MSPIIATSADEYARIRHHLVAIRAILEADVFEEQMGAMLRDYCREHFTYIDEMAEIFDALAAEKIISKIKFRELWAK